MRLICDYFRRRGRTSLFLPPGTNNPSYTTAPNEIVVEGHYAWFCPWGSCICRASCTQYCAIVLVLVVHPVEMSTAPSNPNQSHASPVTPELGLLTTSWLLSVSTVAVTSACCTTMTYYSESVLHCWAASMAGCFSGVQKKVKDVAPLATYVHCTSHVLNLVLNTGSLVSEIRNMFSTVRQITRFINDS